MGTEKIILPAMSFRPLEGSDDLDPALFDPSPQTSEDQGGYPRFTFRDGQQDACETPAFRMPDEFASAPVFKWDWYTSGTTNVCRWAIAIVALSETDADTIEDKDSDADNVLDASADETAKELCQESCALANANEVAGGDLVKLIVKRIGGHENDTLAAPAYFLGGILYYTT